MKRGDILTATPPGEYGKPRPVVVLQDLTPEEIPERITVALITGTLLMLPTIRIPVEPSLENGLRTSSEIAVDNIQTFSVSKLGNVIGALDTRTMKLVDEALRAHLGL